MTTWIDGVIKHSESELELLGLHHTPLGPATLTFIKELHRTLGNQPAFMKIFAKQVVDLIDKKPLAPITEEHFVNDRCTRYPYIYKDPDGRYYNDRAIVFKKSYDDLDSQYIYQGEKIETRDHSTLHFTRGNRYPPMIVSLRSMCITFRPQVGAPGLPNTLVI